jgi:Peptidase family M20/M25/M40
MTDGSMKGIATLPFSGDSRRGPRHAYLLLQLLRSGCNPMIDQHGNIWVENESPSGKGSGPTVLVSSHLDVDPRVRDLSFTSYRENGRRMVRGVLDNAVGCYLNLCLAARKPRKGRVIHVFTASEEVERDNPRRFCRSAREVVRELRARDTYPDFCAVIDVTFPRLMNRDIDWSKPYAEVFDMEDRTHCFIDGYSRRSEKKLVLSLMERAGEGRIGIRYLHGHDETFVYSRICHSFAFGPVVHGDFAKPGQTMPVAHAETALRFLRKAIMA